MTYGLDGYNAIVGDIPAYEVLSRWYDALDAASANCCTVKGRQTLRARLEAMVHCLNQRVPSDVVRIVGHISEDSGERASAARTNAFVAELADGRFAAFVAWAWEGPECTPALKTGTRAEIVGFLRGFDNTDVVDSLEHHCRLERAWVNFLGESRGPSSSR